VDTVEKKKSLVLLRIEPLFPVNSKGFDDGVRHWGLLGFGTFVSHAVF
jgi:hypothetical protein